MPPVPTGDSRDNVSASAQEHRSLAEGRPAARIAIITVSDTRSKARDESGLYLRTAAERDGYVVDSYTLVPDEPSEIDAALNQALGSAADTLILNGGTGIAVRDTTVEVVRRRLDKELPGFGELFRVLSYEQIGAAAMLSRAVAGTIGTMFVAALPGSTAAVRLAWDALIGPELGHIRWELEK